MKIARFAYLVRDYDEAIGWFVSKLGFELIEDTRLSQRKRWVLVAPQRSGPFALVLAKAEGPEQTARVGDQAGGRVFLFLETDDFDASYERMREAGVRFLEKPRVESYGKVVVFEDLYGGKWDLIQPV